MGASGTVSLTLTRDSGIVIPLGVSVDTSTCWVRTKALDLGDPTLRKDLQMMLLSLLEKDSTSAFDVTLSYSDDRDGTFTEISSITVGSGVTKLDPRIAASLYFKVKFGDAAIGAYWKLSAFSFHGAPAGERI
jgi:hypothetical protein